MCFGCCAAIWDWRSGDTIQAAGGPAPNLNHLRVMYHDRYIAKLQQKRSIVNRDLAVLGCSFGHECRTLVEGGARSVVGFDLDARIGRDFSDPRVQYRRESVTDIQLPKASFDIVYSAAVFEHVHDLPRAFAEAARICRPGGTIFIISSPLWYAPYGNHMASILERLPWCHLLYKPRELKQRIHDDYPELPAERVHELLEIIFDPVYFNRLPPQRLSGGVRGSRFHRRSRQYALAGSCESADWRSVSPGLPVARVHPSRPSCRRALLLRYKMLMVFLKTRDGYSPQPSPMGAQPDVAIP